MYGEMSWRLWTQKQGQRKIQEQTADQRMRSTQAYVIKKQPKQAWLG